MNAPITHPPSAWAPLQHRVFRALWLAGTAGFLGLWMQNVAAAWTMTSLSPSPLMVALIQTAATLPAFLLGLPGGVLADLLDRRRLLIATNTWMLLSVATLSILTYTGNVNAWSLLLLTFAVGAGNTLQAPAWQAATSDVLPRPLITAGLSMNAVSANMARAVGPALAGLLILWFGSGAVFTINVFCYLFVISVLLRWKGSARKSGELPSEGLLGGMQTALRYVRHSPSLVKLYGRCLAVYFSGSALWALLPVVARTQLGFGAAGYGLLMAFLGTGAVAGSLMLAQQIHRHGPNRLMQGATLLTALSLLGLGFITDHVIICVVSFLAGVGWIGIGAVPNLVIQTAVPTWVKARAIAVFFLTFQVGMASGSVLWGFIASHFGTPTALAVAAGFVIVSFVIGQRFPMRMGNDADVTPSLHWLDPKVEIEPDMEDGPVAVQLTYQIDPARRQEFTRAAYALGSIRQRDGANTWRLYRDLEEPDRYVERFIVGSWGEYLHQRSRATVTDQETEQRALAFHVGSEPPRMLHFIAEPAPED